MSDDDSSETPRRPSPTSRARRIGGRPTPPPTSRPTPDGADAATADAATADAGTPAPSLTKRTKTPAPKPAARKPEKEPDSKPEKEPDSKPEKELAADTTSSGGFPLRWLPAAVIGVAALALLVIVVVVSHGVYWAKPDDSGSARAATQEQVLASAKKCFATINTYDYRKLDGLAATDLPCTTGKFTSDLKTALQKTIIPQAPKAKAVQTAQINRAGVISVSPDGNQWVALIFGQLVQSNSSTAKSNPRTDLFGAVVTMDNVGGKWLISKVGYDTGNSLGG